MRRVTRTPELRGGGRRRRETARWGEPQEPIKGRTGDAGWVVIVPPARSGGERGRAGAEGRGPPLPAPVLASEVWRSDGSDAGGE